MEEADQDLWARYWQGDREAYSQLVEHYLPIVKITVGRIAMNLPPHIDYEDLYSAGCLGLLSAVERYNPQSGAKFQSYAITRVRGAVIDELRQYDILGRIVRDRVSRIHDAEDALLGRSADCTAEEIATEAGISLDEYHDALRGERASHMVSLSEPVEDGQHTLGEILAARPDFSDGLAHLEEGEILEKVEEILTEKEKLLVVLYYHEELTLKEIGEIMEVSESRVSQLHAEMIARVRRQLARIGV